MNILDYLMGRERLVKKRSNEAKSNDDGGENQLEGKRSRGGCLSEAREGKLSTYARGEVPVTALVPEAFICPN